MLQTTAHPTPEQLRAFGAGRLPAEELAQVEDHVRTCDQCCQVLASMSGDPLADLARDAARTPATPGAAPTATVPPELLDHPRYRILGLIGEGGMGVVFKAEHKVMGRPVALKVISKRLTANKDAVERFRREVKAAAQLGHPNIVTAHDAEEADGLHFLVMEYVEGLSLDRLVARLGPLEVPLACQIIRQVAAGLQHAHSKGMVHRDIKPQNLMVTRKGQVKILDFGLARLSEEGRASRTSMTAPNLVVGTPDYLAPEQARDSHRVDIRADLYALGCTFYFLLTGRVPFAGDSPFEKLLAHSHSDPASILDVRPDVPAEVAAIVTKLMAKRPEDRFQTPAELAAALSAVAQTTTEAAERVELPESELTPPTVSTIAFHREPTPHQRKRIKQRRRRRRPPPNRRPLILAVTAGVLLVALVVGVVALKPWRTSDSNGASPAPAIASHRGSNTIRPIRPFAKQILFILPHHGLFFPDFESTRRELGGKPVELHFASSQPGPVEFYRSAGIDGRPASGESVQATLSLAEPIDARQFDAIIFVGGNVDEFIGDDPVGQHTRQLIQDMLARGKAVASVCTGIKVLIAGGFLDDVPVLPKTWAWHDYVMSNNPQRAMRWQTTDDVVRHGPFVLSPRPETSRTFVHELARVMLSK